MLCVPDLLNHFFEFLLFVLPQILVIFDGGDVELMLGLRLGGLERTGEDGDFNIPQDLVRRVLFSWA